MKIARGKGGIPRKGGILKERGDGVFRYKETNDLPMKFQIVEYSPTFVKKINSFRT